ncbi:MAG TPA: nucleotidyltransferase domain-containing protein [Rhizomicrobium sp.]
MRRNAKTLRARGVARAAVFGSVARREAHADSDVDILIEIDRERAIGLFDYAELCEDIANLFPVRVDVVNSRKLKPLLRDSILRDCIDAF